MKRTIMLVLCTMLCLGALVSCDSMEAMIGEKTSLATLDRLQTELADAGLDTLTRYDADGIADFEATLKQELAKHDLALAGEVTGVLEGRYDNPETGEWFRQIIIGVSMSEDVDTLAQYYRIVYATEFAEDKAYIMDGGWIISISTSSAVMEDAQAAQ